MRHFLYNPLILKVLLMTILFASSGLAVSKSRGKKKIVKETKELNICDIQSQQAPMYCYCNNVGLQNASDVNCWVLSKFERDDPMWGYFTSQIHLEKLTFTVRQIGSLDYVPSQLLHQLKNLRVIVFQYGSLHELAERAFSNLNSVAEINLSRNMIVVVRKYAFENMRNLSVINLDDNRISEINRYG